MASNTPGGFDVFGTNTFSSAGRIPVSVDVQKFEITGGTTNISLTNTAQVTAAALASENKSLAHPASVDSIPTAANQEDHVSMATFAARRLLDMAENTATIIAIELLAAAQGVDFRKPLTTAPALVPVMSEIRSRVAFFARDRYFAPEIAKAKALVTAGGFRVFLGALLPSGAS